MKLDELNGLLQLIAEDNFESMVDAQYDEMVDELSAEFEMMNYAAASYDNDAQYYGEKV
jgi:hypothetical protein